jgi:hypothetical protein
MKNHWQKTTEWRNYECKPILETVEEYNALADKIRHKKENWLELFVLLCQKYYSDERFWCGGSLHIVLDDGNYEDCYVSWCAGYACAMNDGAGSDIANLMLLMTLKQRKQVYEKLHTKQHGITSYAD